MIISYLGGKLTHRFCLVCRQKVSKYFQQITSVMWDHAKDVSKRLTNHIKIRSDIKPQTNPSISSSVADRDILSHMIIDVLNVIKQSKNFKIYYFKS